MWYAGVDGAATHHGVVVLNEQGQHVATKQVAHTVEGLAQLTTFLVGIGGAPERQEELACSIETSRGWLIAAFLEAGFPVSPVPPKTVDRHRQPAGAKTDAIDASLVARTGRSDFADRRRLRPESELIQEFTTLTRDEARLIASQTSLVNQLTACLKSYSPVAFPFFAPASAPFHPGLPPSRPDTPGRRTSLPGRPAAAAQAGQAAAPGPRRPAEVGAAPSAFRCRRMPSPHEPASRLLLALVQHLLLLVDQVAAYDQEIARLFQAHADQPSFSGLPGAGKRLAPRLVAQWGDERTRSASAASVQA